MKTIKNRLVYTEEFGVIKCNLAFDEKIKKISKEPIENGEELSFPEDCIVLPGFIDVHIHGAGGADAMDGTVVALKTIAQTVAKEGTVGFLATTMTQSVENITKALASVKEYRENDKGYGASLLGVHLEGPFIAEKFKGAQPLEYVAVPDVKVFDGYNLASGNAIKIVTLAPEVENAQQLIAHLTKNGVISSIGHTGAKYLDVEKAISNGASHVTHTYNAQSPLHHRDVGTVGSAMIFDQLSTEVIADTIHVSVPAMKLLYKNKPKGKVVLITDAMRAKGLGDGISELGGQKVIVNNGEARLEDGTLAGSVLTMNRAIYNFINKVGVPFEEAVDCATKVPAKELGVYNELGSIKAGKNASFTVVTPDFDVLATLVNGKVVYKKD